MYNINWLKEHNIPIVCQGVSVVNGIKKLNLDPNWTNIDYTNLIEQSRSQGKNHIGINFGFIGKNNVQLEGGSLICLDLDLKPIAKEEIDSIYNKLSAQAIEYSYSGKGLHIFFKVDNVTPVELKNILTKEFGRIKFKNEDNVGLDLFMDNGQVLLANEINWDDMSELTSDNLIIFIKNILNAFNLEQKETHTYGGNRIDYKTLISPGDTWAKLCNKNHVLAQVNRGEWPGYNEVKDYKVPYIYYITGKWNEFIELLQTKWPEHLKQWVGYFDKDDTKAHAELLRKRLETKIDWEVTNNNIKFKKASKEMIIEDLDLWAFGDIKTMWDGKKYTQNYDKVRGGIYNWIVEHLTDEQRTSINESALTKASNEVIDMIISDKIWTDGETSAQKALMPLRNGVLNIHTKKFEDTLRPKILTMIDIDYNPKATGKITEKFVKEIFGKYEPQIKKFLGSTLMRDMNKDPKKWFISIIGKPNAGKSLFTKFVQQLLGDGNYSAVEVKNIDKRFAKAPLYQKLVNIANENSFEDYTNNAEVKQVIGRDNVYIEEKNQKGFFAPIYASFLFMGNEEVNLSIEDSGILARWYQYNLDDVHGGLTPEQRHGKEGWKKIVPWDAYSEQEWKEDALVYILEGLQMYLAASIERTPFDKDEDMINRLKNIGYNQSNLKDWWDSMEQGVVVCEFGCANYVQEFNAAMSTGEWVGGHMNASYQHWLQHNRKASNHFNNHIKSFMEYRGWDVKIIGGNKKKYVKTVKTPS